jgi:hypothetical protein
MRPERVWYLAYGSNVNRARFMRYLAGGETEPGARDASPPARHVWGVVPMRLTFSKESVRWDGGGVAFVDPNQAGQTIVRAWDITADQFEDVFAQENRLDVGTTLDWQAIGTGAYTVGAGWYQRLLPVPLDFASPAQPAVTFTWSSASAYRPPDRRYVETIRSGLGEHDSLDAADVDDYLERHGGTIR